MRIDARFDDDLVDEKLSLARGIADVHNRRRLLDEIIHPSQLSGPLRPEDAFPSLRDDRKRFQPPRLEARIVYLRWRELIHVPEHPRHDRVADGAISITVNLLLSSRCGQRRRNLAPERRFLCNEKEVDHEHTLFFLARPRVVAFVYIFVIHRHCNARCRFKRNMIVATFKVENLSDRNELAKQSEHSSRRHPA